MYISSVQYIYVLFLQKGEKKNAEECCFETHHRDFYQYVGT